MSRQKTQRLKRIRAFNKLNGKLSKLGWTVDQRFDYRARFYRRLTARSMAWVEARKRNSLFIVSYYHGDFASIFPPISSQTELPTRFHSLPDALAAVTVLEVEAKLIQ
jgi:hypothetical protein